MAVMRKVAGMAILGAFGAAVGALVGEMLFQLTPPPRPAGPRSICLLFDVSGSMSKPLGPSLTQLDALKAAAGEFVGRQNFAVDQVGLVVFSSGAQVACPLTGDPDRLRRALWTLSAGGTTDMARGLERAGDMLAGAEGERWILLFSDGRPEGLADARDPEAAALDAAARRREAGIDIVAVGTGLADRALMERLTGRRGSVLFADNGAALDGAFRGSEQAMRNRQMLSSSADGASLGFGALIAAAWAACIAFGAGLALVVGQNRHLRRRRLLSPVELMLLAAGSIATGLIAGATSQSLFFAALQLPGSKVAAVARVCSWLLLGAGLGLGMSAYVPNIHRRRAVIGGVAAGLLSGVGFLTVVPHVSDTAGRIMAAAILGLCTGLTLVLVEVTYRRAWLVVHWGRRESSSLLLGERPIVVGSARDADICPSHGDGAPVRALISLKEGRVLLTDPHSGVSRILGNGDRLTFDRITVEVRAKAA